LIVVVIIVGILASVAIPMMSGNIAAAKKTEAISALGAIRTAERCIYAETNNYVNFASNPGSVAGINTYLRTGDLNGRYYNDACFSVVTGTLINATNGSDGAPAAQMNLITGAIT
jgi:type II secretory pathway pseudopilin PulG